MRTQSLLQSPFRCLKCPPWMSVPPISERRLAVPKHCPLVFEPVARYIDHHHLYQPPDDYYHCCQKRHSPNSSGPSSMAWKTSKPRTSRCLTRSICQSLFERVIVASGTSNRQTKVWRQCARCGRKRVFPNPGWKARPTVNGSSWIAAKPWCTSCSPTFASTTTWKSCGAKSRCVSNWVPPSPPVAESRQAWPPNRPPSRKPSLKRSNAAKKGVAEAFPSKARFKKAAAAKSASVQTTPAKKAAAKKTAPKTTPAKVPVKSVVAKKPAKPASKKVVAKKSASQKSKAAKKPPHVKPDRARCL
jgi:ribosome-associated protein